MNAAGSLYFADEGYRNWQKNLVEPYLKQYRKYGCFHSYDGAVIFYQQYFNAEADICIVISHGFSEFAEKYNEVIYYFLQQGCSVYILEHRGHGYSEREVSDAQKVYIRNFEDYVKDLDCFMKKMNYRMEQHRILFAHSMGGAIAARYVEEHPKVFERAILSSPMFRMQTGKYPWWVAKMTAAFYVKTKRGDRYAAGQSGFSGRPDFEHSSCISRERYYYIFGQRLENSRYQTNGGTYGWLLASMKATEVLMQKKSLERIKIPVLIFIAGNDHMVDNRAIAVFANHVDTASLVCMPASKHEIFNAEYKTRCRYYHEIFDFIMKNRG